MFLINQVTPTEAHEALMAVTGMMASGVKRVVYLSVFDADRAAWLPHFGAKAGVEEAIKQSGIPFTILRPNNFHQNVYWYKDALLLQGVYPQPIGDVGVSSVDVRDIAEAAAIALTTSANEGRTYDLVGPQPLTGKGVAQVLGRALGRPITYAGNDLDAYEKAALTYMPDWLAFDARHMYRYFQEHGFTGSSEAVATETAAAWLGTEASAECMA